MNFALLWRFENVLFLNKISSGHSEDCLYRVLIMAFFAYFQIMALFDYFQCMGSALPKPDGPLSTAVPLSTIMAANKGMKVNETGTRYALLSIQQGKGYKPYADLQADQGTDARTSCQTWYVSYRSPWTPPHNLFIFLRAYLVLLRPASHI